MNTIKSLLMGCLFAAAAGHGAPALSAPQTGWWWNPAESGRGFFVESAKGITFIGAYLYENDGRARWLVSGSANPDPYNYTGELYAMHDGQTLFGGYVSPAGPDNAGRISVHFTDDTHGVVTWPGGTVSIERHVFGGTGAPFQPASGWWWNPKESGRGYSIEVQGDKLFLVGFMYDEAGRPVWYYSAGTMNSLTTYRGPILQFANGQTLGGPYKPPGAPATIGTLTVNFAAREAATLTIDRPAFVGSADAPMLKAGSPSTTLAIQTEFPGPEAQASFPGVYLGTFLSHSTRQMGGFTVDVAFSGGLLYLRTTEDCGPLQACYRAFGGAVSVTATGNLVVPGGGSCHGEGVATYTNNISARLLIDENNHWDAHLAVGDYELDFTVTCTILGFSSTRTEKIEVGMGGAPTGRPIQDVVPLGYIADAGDFTDHIRMNTAFFSLINDASGVGYMIFTPYAY